MVALFLIPYLMYIRKSTIEKMTTPGHDSFHYGMYEKYRKIEYLAFQELISKNFSPKSLKSNLKSTSLDEEIVKRFEEAISHLKEINNTNEKRITQFEEKDVEKAALLQETITSLSQLNEKLEQVTEEKTSYSNTAIKLTDILSRLKDTIKLIAEKGFHETALNNLLIWDKYAIYILDKDKTQFELKYYRGSYTDNLQKDIRIVETKNDVIKAYNHDKIFKGETSYFERILVNETTIVIQIILDEKLIDSLNNNELIFEQNLAKIEIQLAFEQISTCLYLFYTSLLTADSPSLSKSLNNGVQKGVEEHAN